MGWNPHVGHKVIGPTKEARTPKMIVRIVVLEYKQTAIGRIKKPKPKNTKKKVRAVIPKGSPRGIQNIGPSASKRFRGTYKYRI